MTDKYDQLINEFQAENERFKASNDFIESKYNSIENAVEEAKLAETGSREAEESAKLAASEAAEKAANETAQKVGLMYPVNSGNWSTVAGTQLTEADRYKAWDYPDNSGDRYAVRGNVTLPITIPSAPDNRFYLASAVNEARLKEFVNGQNFEKSVATVKDIIKLNLPENSYVNTIGFDNIFDNGGARYLIKSGVADGVISHDLVDGLVAEMDFEKYVNSASVGMLIGNVNADKNSSIIEKCIAHMSNRNLGFYLRLQDIYPVSRTITTPKVNQFGLVGYDVSLSGLLFITGGGQNGINLSDGYFSPRLDNICLNTPTEANSWDFGAAINGDGTAEGRNVSIGTIHVNNWYSTMSLTDTYGGVITKLRSRVSFRHGVTLNNCNNLTFEVLDVAYVGERYNKQTDAINESGWGLVINGGNNNKMLSGNIWNCGGWYNRDGIQLPYNNSGGGVLMTGGANGNKVAYYFEHVGINSHNSNKALMILEGCVGNEFNGGLLYPNVIIDEGAGTVQTSAGQGYFQHRNPSTIIGNIPNPSFQNTAMGTQGWGTNTTEVVQVSHDNSEGFSGNNCLKVDITPDKGDGLLYTFNQGTTGFELDCNSGDIINVGFAMKSTTVLGNNGIEGEAPNAIRYQIGGSVGTDAQPKGWKTTYIGNGWTWVSSKFQVTSSGIARLFFYFINPKENFTVKLTDVIFCKNDMVNHAPSKVNDIPSTSNEVWQIRQAHNELLSKLREQGILL